MKSSKIVSSLVLLALFFVVGNPTMGQSKKPKKSAQKTKAPTEAMTTEPPPVKAFEEAKPHARPTTQDEELESMIKNLEGKSKPIVSDLGDGTVNWSAQTIEATGMSVIDSERFKNPAQARAMAIQGARADAQRKLLETVQGVNVYGETTVRDMIAESDLIITKVEGILKGAVMVGEPVVKDGLVEVKMQIGLYGEKGIAGAVYSDAGKYVEQKSAKRESIAPDESVSPTSAQTIDDKATEESKMPLVFDFKGQKFDPSMFPVVLDEKGQVLLDMYKIYDPKTGKLPKVLQSTSEIMREVGFAKGANILDVIESSPGTIKIDATKSKINWKKIGQTTAKIGKFLLMLL